MIKRHIRGVKHCNVIPIKGQKAMYVGGVESVYRVLNTEQCYSCRRCQKCIGSSQYRVMLLMSEVSKVAQYVS